MTYTQNMSKLLVAGALVVALGATGGAAVARSDGPACHSRQTVTTQTQATPGGIHSRQVTTTREKCGRTVTTTVTYGPWS